MLRDEQETISARWRPRGNISGKHWEVANAVPPLHNGRLLRTPKNVDKKRKHLAMIRRIINRMLVGSFLLKAWAVAIVAALLAVATNAEHARFAWLALFMAIAFWVLDAHFVRQLGLFRKTYERVQSQPESEVDFSMDTAVVDGEATSFGSALFSRSLGAFYGTVLGLIGVARWVLG